MRRGVIPIIVLIVAGLIVAGVIYYKVSEESKRPVVEPLYFPEDDSVMIDVRFTVKNIDYSTNKIVFEVDNQENSRLDSFLFLVYTAAGYVETKHFNYAIPPLSKKTFEHILTSDLLSCPYKIELIPQRFLNNKLTSFIRSTQIYYPKCDSKDSLSNSSTVQCPKTGCKKPEAIPTPFYQPFLDPLTTPQPTFKPPQVVEPAPNCVVNEAYWSTLPNGINPFQNLFVTDETMVYVNVVTSNCADGVVIPISVCEFEGDSCDVSDIPYGIGLPSSVVISGGRGVASWQANYFDELNYVTDASPELRFNAEVLGQVVLSNLLEILPIVKDVEGETHLECVNRQCVEVNGTGTDTCSPLGVSCGVLEGPDYPKLHANIFSHLYDTNFCRIALSAYGGVTTDSVFSSGRGGGYDYGALNGYGTYKNKKYKLGDTSPDDQVLYTAVKKLNPDFKLFSHTSIKKVEPDAFDAGTTYPKRWFLDSLSPRWYAYSPLMELQEAVTDGSTQVIFKFPRRDVEKLIRWGVSGTGRAYWAEDNTKWEWAYLSFFDNNRGGGRGTQEIMAIKDIELTPDQGIITVALNNNTEGRTIFGSPQSYSKGHRAGVLSNSDPGFGSLAFLMNRYCTRELEATTNCKEIRVDGLNWLEAAAEYADLFLIPASYDGVYLNDGLEMDADDTIWRAYGFRLAGARKEEYHLDLDFDGLVDDFDAVSEHLPELYQEFSKIIKTEVMPKHNRDDFMVLVNGELNRGSNLASPINYPYINARRFEDLNAEFEGSYKDAVEQYQQIYSDKNFLGQPVYVALTERARYAYDAGTEDYEEHRNILALTLVLGNGNYDHDYYHDTGIPVCTRRARDDWRDEFSVDDNGVSSLHPTYSADVVCDEVGRCDKNRFQHIGWLGKALGEGYPIAGYNNAWRRDFEKGSAFFSMENREVRVQLEKPFKKILGADPDNTGVLYNDGSIVTEVVLLPVNKDHKGRGMVLLKT